MLTNRHVVSAGITLALAASSAFAAAAQLWVFGDSTVKDYTNAQDACSTVLKISGWGEFIAQELAPDSLQGVASVISASGLTLQNRANGGRAARSFITGADSNILKTAYKNMKAGDYMLIQFGHNDEALCADYPDRCTSVADYKKFLGMYVDSVLKRNATPILVTPMVRYSWPEYDTHDNSDGKSKSIQVGNYPLAMQQVAKEKGVPSVDLTQRSIDLFNAAGSETTQYRYFRKVKSGTSLPSGCASINDGTHFQPGGAQALAHQIHLGLKSLRKIQVEIRDTSKGTVIGTSNGVKDKTNKNWLQLTNDFRVGPGWYENDHNPTVKIEAKPKSGYKFARWSGDATGTTNPLTVTMDRSYAIVATFVSTSSSIETVRNSSIGPVLRYDRIRGSLRLEAADGHSMRVRISSANGTFREAAEIAGSGEMSLRHLPSGLYLARIEGESPASTLKFVVP